MITGHLNTPIRIEHRGATYDALGQPVPGDWQPHADDCANVRHLSGVESIKAGATVSSVAASVRIRYRTDIDASMRVRIGGAVYEIRAVLPDLQKREFVDLVCQVVQ